MGEDRVTEKKLLHKIIDNWLDEAIVITGETIEMYLWSMGYAITDVFSKSSQPDDVKNHSLDRWADDGGPVFDDNGP
jgi:hypothetical protein